MERKSKVTQSAVNAACEQLQAYSKNVTVNVVISITGGSFSTVGDMVKLWREEQAVHSAPLLQMPESVTSAMHKAAIDVDDSTIGKPLYLLIGNDLGKLTAKVITALWTDGSVSAIAGFIYVDRETGEFTANSTDGTNWESKEY